MKIEPWWLELVIIVLWILALIDGFILGVIWTHYQAWKEFEEIEKLRWGKPRLPKLIKKRAGE